MTSSENERDPLEVLFSEYLDQFRRGTATSIEMFARQHEAQAEEIRELFPTLLALEQASRPALDASSSQASEISSLISGGLQLGEYQLLREIGAGGMGIVYEAIQESMQRRVAVKVLPREFSKDPVRRMRFLQEARMAARLSFPNIVPVIDFGESGGRCFFAMRLIEGVGLDWVIQRLRDNSEPLVSSEVGEHFRIQGIPLQGDDPEADDDDSLACEFNSIRGQEGAAEKPAEKWQLRRDSWRQFARIGIQAAKALQHAHKAGIWHRDVKPGNLLLDEAGVIWITDFGLAKSERNLSLTASNDVVGTLRYLAPERFDGKLDARSDIYGLGLTLLELALQQHAFDESARTTLIRSIMDGRITPPRQINPQLPEPLERILLKATATKPSARYATAQALIHDLRAFAKGEQVSLPVPVQRQPRRLVIPWKPLTIVLAGICLLQGALLWHAREQDKGSALPGEQPAPFQASLRERLQALDGLYEQVLRRDLVHDIRNRTTVEPLPAYSIQHAALEHLLILYSRARDEAEAAQWTADREEFQLRVDLLSHLKGR